MNFKRGIGIIVYYEELKSGGTVNGDRCNHNSSICMTLYAENDLNGTRDILHHDNASCHHPSIICDTIKMLKWNLLQHLPYPPDLAPSDFHLFSLMVHGLAALHFTSFEEMQDWLKEWFLSNNTLFYSRGTYASPERWPNVKRARCDIL